MASISVSKCLDPLEVTASGNSAVSLSLNKVTFFTSTKLFWLFFSIKKSNLVSLLKNTSDFILSLFFTPFGCSKIVEQNGVPTNDEIFQQLNIGKSTKSKVKKILGEPLILDNQLEETWIYFSQKIEKFAFFEPKLSSRKVILLSFKNNILIKKETFSQKDSKIIEISTKKVISGGRKLTVLQQIFGNIGNFSSQNFQQD